MKRLPSILMAGVLSVGLMGLTGCSWFQADEPDTDPTPTYNIDPDDLPDSTNPPNPEKRTLSTPTEDLGRYTTQELAGAQQTAQNYIQASLTTPELLSGEWWEDGHNMNTLAELGTFSEDLQNDIKALNPETGIGAQATQSIALFLTETEEVQATKECKAGENCSGEPFYSQETWSETNDNVVKLEVSASVVRPLVKGGSIVHSVDTFNYAIQMSYHDKESQWEINELENSYTIGKNTEAEEGEQ